MELSGRLMASRDLLEPKNGGDETMISGNRSYAN